MGIGAWSNSKTGSSDWDYSGGRCRVGVQKSLRTYEGAVMQFLCLPEKIQSPGSVLEEVERTIHIATCKVDSYSQPLEAGRVSEPILEWDITVFKEAL